MMDPFSLATGIAGLVSLTIEIVKISYEYGSGIKGAPKAISSLIQELLAFKNVLSDLQNNVILNPDVAAAFEARNSSVLERLASEVPNNAATGQAPSMTLQKRCELDLQDLLAKLQKKVEHGKVGMAISRLSWPLSEPEHQKKIDMLQRYQSIFQSCIAIDTLTLVAKTHEEIKTIRAEKVETVELERQKRILQWLSPLTFLDKQRDANSRRHPKTGKWLMDSDEVRRWIETPPTSRHTALWCPGEPGAGKTMIASMMIDRLNTLVRSQKCGLAYIYIIYDDQTNQTPSHLLGSLVKQLVQQCQPFPACVNGLYDSDLKEPDVDHCMQMLVALSGMFTKTFVVIDALDESDNDTQKYRKSLLGAIVKLMATDIRIFATSRTTFGDINSVFSKTPTVPISAKSDDLRIFLTTSIEENEDLSDLIADDEELQANIINTIIEKSGGQFLLPALHIDRLGEYTCRSEVEEALSDMTGSIQKTYEASLRRFERHSPARQDLAMSILMWLTHTKSPMTFEELREALAVKPGTKSLDRKSLRNKKVMLDVCLGLVIIETSGLSSDSEDVRNDYPMVAASLEVEDEKSPLKVWKRGMGLEESDGQPNGHATDTIRLAHFTLQEYLAENSSRLWPNAESILAKTCLTYLLHENLPIGMFSELDMSLGLGTVPTEHKFSQYALRNWSGHARQCDADTIKALAVQYFHQRKPSLIPDIQGWWHIGKPLPSDSSTDIIGYTAAFFLPSLAGLVLADQNLAVDLHACSDRVSPFIYWSGRTKAFWADSHHKYLEPLRNELLQLALADPLFFRRANAYTRNYMIDLMAWIDDSIRQRLLDIGFDVHWRQATYEHHTALDLAYLGRCEAGVKFLIRNGAGSDSQILEWFNSGERLPDDPNKETAYDEAWWQAAAKEAAAKAAAIEEASSTAYRTTTYEEETSTSIALMDGTDSVARLWNVHPEVIEESEGVLPPRVAPGIIICPPSPPLLMETLQ